MERRFYVYEHWRPDKDVCFWVGKGTGDRAYRFKRNTDYDTIIAALADIGMCAEVRLVKNGLLEREALFAEQERIAFWRAAGIKLTNRSDGGDGCRGILMTEETRQKLRAANLGKKLPTEVRAKMSATHKRIGSVKRLPKGRPGPHSAGSRAKMGMGHRGKVVSEATREKLRRANIGKTHSAETRALLSLKGKGLKRSEKTKNRISAGLIGRRVSEATRLKISATKRARSKLEAV